MICAYTDLADLRDSVEKIEEESKGGQVNGFRVCRLTQRTYINDTDDYEDWSFYALIFPPDKVTATKEAHKFASAIDSYQPVKSETIESVWSDKQTWDACFDSFSLKVEEHKRVRVNDCGFVLDNIVWPALAGANRDDNDWTITELEASLSALNIEVEACKKSIDEDWHVLSPSEIRQSPESSKISYKAIVIRGEETAKEMPALVPLPKAPAAPWVPKIQVKEGSKRRLDKLYLDQAPPTPQECDEDFDSQYFESTTFLKGSVGLTRKLTVTKVRPRAADQKMKRIADKVKVKA